MKPSRYTVAELEKLLKAGTIKSYNLGEAGMVAKKSKYGSKIVEVDGIKFHSKKEANRYFELKVLQLSGVIRELKLQVPYELNPGGVFSYKYICDFQYLDVKTGKEFVEDVKGFITREFKKKRRLMKEVHGIIITEK